MYLIFAIKHVTNNIKCDIYAKNNGNNLVLSIILLKITTKLNGCLVKIKIISKIMNMSIHFTLTSTVVLEIFISICPP